MPKMEFEELVRSRYSCRRFLPEPVPRRIIEGILGLAQQTPSWCNTQPWRLLLVSGAALGQFRERLYAYAAAGHAPKPDFAFPLRYEGIYRERRKVCGVQLYQSLGIGREDRAAAAEQSLENFRLFGAPHLALITTEEDLGVYGALDCGLYIANFMLAVKNAGLDSIAQAALASHADFIRAYFDLPAQRKLVCGIAFGYGDASHPVNGYRTARAGIMDAVTFVD
jgi:nitroreductase